MSGSQSSFKRAAITSTITGTVLAVPIVTSAHFGQMTLKKGMNNEHVVTLQKTLKHEGYYKLSKETGYFGTTTEKAVKAFQKDKGLKVDGLVGPKTKEALGDSQSGSKKLIKFGDKGKDVEYIQKRLKELGYYKGNLDGIFGPLTKDAVINFQSTNEIAVDGLVGNQTIGTLKNHPVSYRKPKTKTVSSHKEVNNTSRSAANIKAVKEFYVNSTAYTAYCAGCSGVTATGINLRSNPKAKVVAVDPNVIPLGTKLYVEGYGYAIAGDTGGAIKGKRVDLFMADRSKALEWGRRTVKIKILELP